MSEEHEPKLVSRRTLLKKAAAISVGVTAASALSACAPAGASSTSKTQKWDKEVDVLVIGSGTVAMAAISAKDAGASSVLIIEKGPAFGGTSALSGGGMWIPVNYLMKEKGIEDNKADALKYLQTVSAGQSTDELMNSYLDNGNGMLEWLRDKYKFEFALGSPMFNDYYELPGFRPYGRSVYYAENGQSIMGSGGWKKIKATCDQLGIETLLNTAGKKLVSDETGEVIGVIATDENGKEIAIHAKKGVILGTGGFDFNSDMTNGYLRGPILGSVAVRTNTGDGQLMGMAIGADLRNMNSCWGLPFFPQNPEKLQGVEDWQTYRGKPGAVIVNKYGERFGDESAAYHVFNRSFWNWDSGKFEWRNIPAYWICDSTFPQNYPMPGANYKMGVIPEWIKTADTLEGLCKALGVDPVGFNSTITTFNENAKKGLDPAWHRGEYAFDKNTAGDLSGKRTELVNNCLAPLEKGPFYGAEYGPGTCGTNGGLRINGNAQVIDVYGQPIPRLYAVGNTSGSVMGAAYPGGGATVGAGCVMGYVAGKHAAALASLA